MKNFNLTIAMVLILLTSAFTQTAAEQQDAVRKQAEFNSAKAELEEARQKRDVIVAQRWQAKKVANDFREDFNQKYQNSREKLDLVAAEKSRILEELRGLKADMDQLKLAQEKARSEFISLSAQDDKIESLEGVLKTSTPFGVNERINRINGLKKSINLVKDKPEIVVDSLIASALAELKFTRTVETKQSDLVFSGSKIGYGLKTRLGGVGGLQFDSQQNKGALLLSAAGEKGKTFIWQSEMVAANKSMIEAAYKGSPTNDSALVYIPSDVLLSTSLSSEISSHTEKTFGSWALKIFKDGGVLMYPILGLFLLALMITIERFIVWFIYNKTSKKQLNEVFQLCEKGELEKAESSAKTLTGSVGNVVKAILSKRTKSRLVAEKSVEEVLAHEVPSLEKRLKTISVLGSAAPLLGLLGTVYGMINLFEVITLYGTSDPKLLAGGISIALVTTETGLAVAIPVQLLHNFISNRVDQLISKLEKEALRFLNVIWTEE